MLRKQIALFLVISLMLTSLTSCSLFASVNIENGKPVASNFKNENEINTEINSFYDEIDKVLDENCSDAQITYSSKKTDSGFVISSQISRDGVSIDIPELTVTKEGAVQKPDEAQTEFLKDGDFIDGALRLKSRGMDIDTSLYAQNQRQNSMYAMAVEYYDTFHADDSISADLTFDERAYKLGITNYLGETDEDDSELLIDNYSAVALTKNLMKVLLSNAYGYSSDEISCKQLLTATKLFADVCTYFRTDLKDVYAQFLQDAEDYLNQAETIYGSASRIAVAEAFVSAYENQFEAKSKKDIYTSFRDTDSLEAKKSVEYLMLNSLPGVEMFSGEYEIHSGEMPETASSIEFAVQSAYDIQNETEYAMYKMTYGGQVAVMGMLDKYLSQNYIKHEDTPVFVDNGGDNSWFVSQLDGSYYESINCMPSISSMGIKWYYGESDVTPSKLREEYGDGSYSGWFMYQVEECLDAYKVPYNVVDNVSAEAMTEALDRGSIILTQMSEAPKGESGHCFVIYGYRKYGDSLIFFVNDPDGDIGKGKKIDSAYVYFIVSRFTGEFVEITK